MSECTESPEKKAKRLGLRLVRPEPHQLFIDCDSGEAHDRALDLIVLHRELFPEKIRYYTSQLSRTPGHYHLIVTLDEPVKDATERVLLQLALGSDRKREVLALKQIDDGSEDDSSVFFEALPGTLPRSKDDGYIHI